jgi:hypothetical protein
MIQIDADHLTLKTARIALAQDGYIRLPGRETFLLLGSDAIDGWQSFAASWGRLGEDLYMADGGRYRRRRHGAFRHVDGRAVRKPHQAHYQSRDYNRLNGDVQRWFDPVEDAISRHPVMESIFRLCGGFLPGRPGKTWHAELHQFRIEADAQAAGRPTPEGLHRDGVDWVFVMLVDRVNVREGVTQIGGADGKPLGRFTLTNPGDAIFLDDHRILHGVTEIHPVEEDKPAYRDALVLTFKAE